MTEEQRRIWIQKWLDQKQAYPPRHYKPNSDPSHDRNPNRGICPIHKCWIENNGDCNACIWDQ